MEAAALLVTSDLATEGDPGPGLLEGGAGSEAWDCDFFVDDGLDF